MFMSLILGPNVLPLSVEALNITSKSPDLLTFKSPDELKKLYEPKGIPPDKEIIAYCRIGERSSHTWFVLKYLLGYPDVKNYDGSWTSEEI
jgi:3-mercaptopyruvate sulfurtransferase SseA